MTEEIRDPERRLSRLALAIACKVPTVHIEAMRHAGAAPHLDARRLTVQDPEYFNMKRRETYHFHVMENDNIDVTKYIESFGKELQEFLCRLETKLGFYPSCKDVKFNYRIRYPERRGYDTEDGVAQGQFTYKHTESDKDHYTRISKELSEMKAYYACKIKQANDLVESKKEHFSESYSRRNL